MAKKTKLVYERVEDQGGAFEPVDPHELGEALGADEFATGGAGKSPFSMWALRSRLFSEIVSTGGRPARRSAALRKIPVTDSEWAALDGIVSLLKQQGVNATAGQLAGVLLHQSLAEVLRRLDSVTPATNHETATAKPMTNADLEDTLESVLAAAAKAKVHLEELRPVALELLRQMRDDEETLSDDKQ